MTGGEKPGHMVSRGTAAGPIVAGSILAGLVEFRCVDAKEPDTVVSQPEAVAVAGAGPAGNGLGSRVENACGKRNDGEKDEH